MSPSVHPDALAAARVGAGWAFERVYAALAPAVLGYVRSQGARDPESVVQDVFVKVFKRIDTFEGTDAQFRSWVFAIAHNHLVDERRFLARRPVDTAPVVDIDVPPAVDAESDAFRRLGTDRVRAILEMLAPDQRDVLLLRVVADLSLEEVAVATGRTVGAVKSLQKRGLDALRRRLEEILPEAVSR